MENMETSAANEVVETAVEVAEPQFTDSAKETKPEKVDTKAETKAMSDRINQIRAEHSKILEAKDNEIRGLSKIADALRQNGFKGDTSEDLLYDFMSSVEGISSEEIRNRETLKAQQEVELERQRREQILNDPEIKGLLEAGRNAQFENQARKDLDEIKAKYPELQATSVFDLGDEFIDLRAKGIDPVKAYRLSLMEKEDAQKSVPPTTGSFTKSETEDKEYYSPEEANRFTVDDYMKNPKLLEKVTKSMPKWRY